MFSIKLIKKKINRKIFILRSKKIALALRKVLKKPIIGIVDIGAAPGSWTQYAAFFVFRKRGMVWTWTT